MRAHDFGNQGFGVKGWVGSTSQGWGLWEQQPGRMEDVQWSERGCARHRSTTRRKPPLPRLQVPIS